MNIFITGATGYVGQQLANALAAEGNTLHALVRSIPKAQKLISHPNIKIFEGNLQDTASIEKAMEGCQQVYHLAAYAKVWDKDPNAFYKINVEGTNNILDAALKNNIQRVVVTSTAGVLGPAINGTVNEDSPLAMPLSTDYERTKLASEKEIAKYVEKGLEVIIVNPTRIYGPGQITVSNAVTKLINQYRLGTWKFLPGDGKSIGNYVYIDDVVNGHILAMQKGKKGERYILGGENASFLSFFRKIGGQTGRVRKLLKLPIWLMMVFARLQLFLAKAFGRIPMITPPFVRRYLYNWVLSTEKAEKELGYEPVSLHEGIAKTILWLQQSDNQKTK